MLLPGCVCCQFARCFVVKFTDWRGDARTYHADFARGDTLNFLDPTPAVPFTFSTPVTTGYGPSGSLTVLVENELIRCTYTPPFGESGSIVLERSGSHELMSGEAVTVSTLVSDTYTPSLTASGIYGEKKRITQVGSISIRLDQATQPGVLSCGFKGWPTAYGEPDYSPETYTLQFQPIATAVKPTGPRSYTAVLGAAQQSQWSDGIAAPPGVTRWSAFLPRGPELRDRFYNPYYPTYGPPNYRYVSPGCDGHLWRLAQPIVMRRLVDNPTMWMSDFITISNYQQVRYAFKSYPAGNGFGVPTLYVFTQNGQNLVQSAFTFSTTGIDASWRRLEYQATPTKFAEDLAQVQYNFGDDGDPFATVVSGGTYSPETVLSCGDLSRLAGCNGLACPPTSATVTLSSTQQFPFGGSYTIHGDPLSGYYGRFPHPDWGWVNVSVLFGRYESFGSGTVCACDAPFYMSINVNAQAGQVSIGASWQVSGDVNACYGGCNIPSVTGTNAGTGIYSQPYNPTIGIDVDSTVEVSFG